KLKSDAEAAAPLEGATRRGETKSKRVEFEYVIDRASHGIRLSANYGSGLGAEQRRCGRESRKELPQEAIFALLDVLDALAANPDAFPGRVRNISRDGSIRLYSHPSPPLQVTFEVDTSRRVLYLQHFVCPKVQATKPVFISYSHKKQPPSGSGMPFAQMSKGAMTSVVGLVADLADRDAVLARRLNLEPFDRGRNRLFLRVGGDGAEMFGASMDQIDAPAGHVTSTQVGAARTSPPRRVHGDRLSGTQTPS
ncbi:hypothetical protein, partial [Bradyrhizobium sp.]|uniref:hypothetical protein n=1 Tax=Bradyrhizobium sp. TaxID=376 RepID=UPI003C75085E